MKVNGNKKNNHHHDSAETKTDQLSKNAIEVVDEIPVKNFDPAKTWLKISERLGNMDKRFVTWGLAMAASFSMLVAANLDDFEWIEIPAEPTLASNHVEAKIKSKTTSGKPQSIPSFLELESIVPNQAPTPLTKVVPVNPTTNENLPALRPSENSTDEMVGIKPFSNPFISGFAKASFQSFGVSPELGVDFKLKENYTARRREIYKLGLSSQLNFSTAGEGQRKTHTHFFVNLEYANLNKKTNKGWTARSGYLLNPDGQLFQDTTIKVSLLRNIGKNLKVGPEVIFTNNLTKTYPAISLILG